MAMREINKPEFTKSVVLPNGSQKRVLTDEFERFKEIRLMAYGAPRRNELMKLLQDGFSFQVNAKHCIVLDNDPDVERLLKKGKIELYTVKIKKNCKHTFVRIKDEKETGDSSN